MSTRKIATSSLWQLSSQAVALVLGMLSVKVVTTALSKELVGNYQTVYGYLQIFGILADFGLYAIAVRELASSAHKARTFASLFVLRLCITVLSLGTALILAFALPAFRGTPLPTGVLLAALVPFFTLLSGMFRTAFQVEYKMQYVCLTEIIGKAVPLLMMSGALMSGIEQSTQVFYLYGFLLAGGVGALLLFLLSSRFAIGLPSLTGLYQAKHRRFAHGLPALCLGLPKLCQGVYHSFSKEEFLLLLRKSAPFGLAFLMTTLYRQSDLTMMAILRPEDYDLQNAYYGVTMRLAEVGFLLPTLILNSTLPLMNRVDDSVTSAHRVLLGTVLLALLTLGSVVALTAHFWARPIVLLLTRETYLATPLSPGSDTALEFLAYSMFLGFVVSFCFYVLLTLHRWKALLLMTGTAALLSIALNMVLIPLYGFIGAAITSVIVHSVLSFGLTMVLLIHKPINLRFSWFARWVTFSVLFGLLLVWTEPLLISSSWTIGGGVIAIAGATALALFCGLVQLPLTAKDKLSG